jgi:hypothetical protein
VAVTMGLWKLVQIQAVWTSSDADNYIAFFLFYNYLSENFPIIVIDYD